LALLGTLPDAEVARRTGRAEAAVTHKRNKLGIPTADDHRRLNGRSARSPADLSFPPAPVHNGLMFWPHRPKPDYPQPLHPGLAPLKAEVGTGSLAPVPWGKAAGLGTAWAVAASAVSALLWWWTHPTWGSPMLLFLILPPGLVLVLSGVVHRSARVALLGAFFTAALNVGLFILLFGCRRRDFTAAQPFTVIGSRLAAGASTAESRRHRRSHRGCRTRRGRLRGRSPMRHSPGKGSPCSS
jgi:hypothetical protein